jgi:hypothetical protein
MLSPARLLIQNSALRGYTPMLRLLSVDSTRRQHTVAYASQTEAPAMSPTSAELRTQLLDLIRYDLLGPATGPD